jgi:hypothetical protein
MNTTEAAAKMAVLERQIKILAEQVADFRQQLLEGEIFILPLKYSQLDLYRNDHVHNRAGRCLKNRYGALCE